MAHTVEQLRADLPHIAGPLPGPRAAALIARDAEVVSPSYTRGYPLVAAKGEGAIVEDVDGNRFLDFNAGIAVVATGHCHPEVVRAIQKQAARLIHMSGTDFYYEEMVALAETLARIAPGDVLVTRVAGPVLGQVLPRVAGVVAELGGSTSHLASLARERGIPMVLGVRDATAKIPAGAQVAVDGVAGIVRWID